MQSNRTEVRPLFSDPGGCWRKWVWNKQQMQDDKGKSVMVEIHSDCEGNKSSPLGWVALAVRTTQELSHKEVGRSIAIMKCITKVDPGKNSCPEDTAVTLANMPGPFLQALRSVPF